MKEHEPRFFECENYCFACVHGQCKILSAPARPNNDGCPFYKTPQKAAEDRKAAEKRISELGLDTVYGPKFHRWYRQ